MGIAGYVVQGGRGTALSAGSGGRSSWFLTEVQLNLDSRPQRGCGCVEVPMVGPGAKGKR